MSNDLEREPFKDLFVFETLQLIDQLEQLILSFERTNGVEASIDEVFRIMHTIKGSAAMMSYGSITSVAHSVEDIFNHIREHKPQKVNYRELTDIVLNAVDFIKDKVSEIRDGEIAAAKQDNEETEPEVSSFDEKVKSFMSELKLLSPDSTGQMKEVMVEKKKREEGVSGTGNGQSIKKNKFRVEMFFEEGCEMENIRAFAVIHKLQEIAEDIYYSPEDIMDNDESAEEIKEEGFKIKFSSSLSLEEIKSVFLETMFLKDISVVTEKDDSEKSGQNNPELKSSNQQVFEKSSTCSKNDLAVKSNSFQLSRQSMISVSTDKLDRLMDLVGELVISEAMVLQNPELKDLNLEGFRKDARQLQKITNELRDIVMSIRMVPLSVTFQKMNRIVRDMSIKLDKKVDLDIVGEETEVDKNIIDHISDPLMHIIRNSIDHGIENVSERIKKGKLETGRIILEAKNAGGDVWITVKDDGKGLDKERILSVAKENGLVNKADSELSDKEIYSYIFSPGFSTKGNATEFSGRGVGLDVVNKNIEKLGGVVSVDSSPGEGSIISIKIPLTLAIIDGMLIRVGKAIYTIPTICIKESFRADSKDIIVDTYGNEMIMVRGKCIRIVRLHKLFKVKTETTNIHEGIIIMVEDESVNLCLFADALLGQQQVVIKSLPEFFNKVKGISGCTLLGDGSISLIIDIQGLSN